MRARRGNPFHDQHELRHPAWSTRVYDFIAPEGTDPVQAAIGMELVVPDLVAFNRGPGLGGANASVWTSIRPDGSLYVALGVYDQTCTDPQCDAGHVTKGKGAPVTAGPAVTKEHRAEISHLLDESDDWPLGAGYDAEILSGLGFLPVDAPLADTPYKEADVYRGLDALLMADENTWAFKVTQLHQSGFTVVFDKQRPEVWPVLEKRIGFTRIGKVVA